MALNRRLKFVVVSYLLAATALHLAMFWTVRNVARQGLPDFSIFYTAGLILRRGEPARMYDDSLQYQVQQEFAPALVMASGRPLPYNHPPFEAPLYLPFALLPYFTAYLLWGALNFVLLVAIGYLLRPHLVPLSSWLPWWPWIAGIAFFPVADTLSLGQDSILLLLAYALVFVCLISGNDAWAGVFLGLGLFKFQLVLPFVFILLLRRKWRFVAGFAVSGAGLTLLSAAIVGWRTLLSYPVYVWQVNRHGRAGVIVTNDMPDLRGLIAGLPGHISPAGLDAVTAVLSLVLLIWAAFRWKISGPRQAPGWIAGFAIAVTAAFLSGYHAYIQDMSILLLPILLMSDSLLHGRGEKRRSAAVAACMAVLFFSPLYLILALRYPHRNLFALVVLGFAAAIAWWSVSPGPGPQTTAG
jgi:alpha-1,2-mannosyltransferase